MTVSPLLADLVAGALTVAWETGGDVDLTVEAALCGPGFACGLDLLALSRGDRALSCWPVTVLPVTRRRRGF